MDKLRSFYKNRLQALAIALAFFAIFIVKNVTPWVETNVIPWVSRHFPPIIAEPVTKIGPELLVSSGFFAALFLVGEWIIRNHYWKFVYRDLDFSGEWLGATQYIGFEGETETVRKTNFEAFSSKHSIFIEQDCTKIAITPSPGVDFVNWRSLAVSLADDGTLTYAYWVNYSDPVRFPENAIGYEKMNVLKDPKNKNIPIVMSGVFYHCAQKDKKPVYRGNTVFIRKQYCNSIEKDTLPSFAQFLLDEGCSNVK